MIRSNRDPSLTAVRARELFSYDPLTGDLRRKTSPAPNAQAGDLAGWLENGYRMVGVNGLNYMAHDLIWLMETGEWPPYDIDHRDRDRGNNRWENLREATRSQNVANSGPRSTNKSGLKGVSWNTKSKKWYASITVNYKQMSLGVHSCKACAYFAYVIAADKHFGEFARIS